MHKVYKIYSKILFIAKSSLEYTLQSEAISQTDKNQAEFVVIWKQNKRSMKYYAITSLVKQTRPLHGT